MNSKDQETAPKPQKIRRCRGGLPVSTDIKAGMVPPHDHIGDFYFKVTINGVTVSAFKDPD